MDLTGITGFALGVTGPALGVKHMMRFKLCPSLLVLCGVHVLFSLLWLCPSHPVMFVASFLRSFVPSFLLVASQSHDWTLRTSYAQCHQFILDFVLCTLSTVGYGDFAPRTAAGRTFMVLYSTIGLVLFGMFLSALQNFVKVRRRSVVLKRTTCVLHAYYMRTTCVLQAGNRRATGGQQEGDRWGSKD